MEFRFSIEIKQEGQIKQEPGIFNLVLSAQRHTHGELHLGTREEALSWGEDPSSLWRQLWEAMLEPIGISTCPPGFHVFCPFLHLSISLWEEAQNSTLRKHRDQGRRLQPLPSSTRLPPMWLPPLGDLFQASPECPSFSLQVTNLPSPTYHPLPITFSF